MDLERSPSVEMPASSRTRRLSGLTEPGCVPAEWASTRSPPRCRSSASPRIERALLPVQTTRTRMGAASPWNAP